MLQSILLALRYIGVSTGFWHCMFNARTLVYGELGIALATPPLTRGW